MPSAPLSSVSGPPSPDRTLKLRGPGRAAAAGEPTGFELNESVAAPASHSARPTRTDRLDPETRQSFHLRLRLCCLIALVPIAFFFVCSLTPVVPMFGYMAVGAVGATLGGGVVVSLAAIAVLMFRRPVLSERMLRVLEVAVFGMLALFFAYWQFVVQTAGPDDFYTARDRRLVMQFSPPPRTEAARPPTDVPPPQPPPPEPDGPPVVEPPAKVDTTAGADTTRVNERNELEREMTAIHERTQVLAAALVVHFNWLLLIVFHAVLVPNTLARGVGVTVALTFTPLAIDTVVAATHTPAQQNPVALFAVAVTMLAAGGGLAVFGTAKIAELQRQVATAQQAVREMGQYRLRRKLGSGGMGEVYLAEHRLLKRPCALKRIHSKYLNNAEQLRRFEREVQATARLRHPNTVEIYDYGVATDGTFFYVMEFLPGMSLEELVGKHGPQPPERVVYLMRQVCGALREAHAAGLVHRDIKPGNIVVFPAGTPHDQVKLVDFGLVHSLAEVEKPNERITRDGLIVGTPEYMSPEQASGGLLDGRSDLFSLGSVAYYLLTGREAFHRDNAMKTLMAVVAETPTPVHELHPFAPDDLTAVLARCLHKDPGQRYQSASDLEHALAVCRCASTWTEGRSNDWWADHPSESAGGGTDLNSLPLRDSIG
jgi:tRNA A-37 threonylcarbamoyl transferase component Bud32